MHVIAEEEVNVEELNREIDRRTVEIQKFKGSLLAICTNLGSAEVVTTSMVSPMGAKRELAMKFQQFKTLEETLGSKRQILEARQKALQAARENLEGMLTTKQDLQVQLEQLDAREDVAGSRSCQQCDDRRYATESGQGFDPGS